MPDQTPPSRERIDELAMALELAANEIDRKDAQIAALSTEVERLKGILSAEELLSAERGGEVERLTQENKRLRDSIDLYTRGAMAELQQLRQQGAEPK